MKQFASLIAVLLITAGCATTNEFHSYQEKPDQFKPGVIHYYSDDITIKENELLNQGYSTFDFNFTKTPTNNIWHINTTYHAEEWLFIGSIQFMVDGKIYNFKTQPSPKRETGIAATSYVEEHNQFILSDSFIEAIRSAQTITLRLEGQHYYLDRTLSTQDIKNINWFISYVKTKV